MAIPTDRLYNINRLNIWFAVSSVVMLASILWMSYVDYDRPWHDYQDDYMSAQSNLAHLDYLGTQRASSRARLEAAEQALAQARQRVAEEQARRQALADQLAQAERHIADADQPAGSELASLRAEVQAAPTQTAWNAELARLEDQLDAIKIEFSAADATSKVTAANYEHVLGELGPQHPRIRAARARLDAERQALNALRLAKERNEDRQDELRRMLAEANAPITEAQRVYDRLAKAAADAQKRDDQYGNRFIKGVINLPFVDFAAPKGTPARYEVRQLVLPDVRQRLNYLDSYTTDRCTTCHLAIDDPGFSRDALAARLEDSLPAINEERTRQGMSPLSFPPVPAISGDAAPELEAGRVAEHWDALTDSQQDEYFEALLAAVNRYLTEAGRDPLRFEQPVTAHPDLELFVHADSPHPMKRMGCTVCHEGNPQETDFVLAAHTPKDHRQEHQWAHEYYVRAAGVPKATFALVEHYWDRPMLLSQYAEAGCVKCHVEVTDIGAYDGKPQGRSINLGENLFMHSGCINCHLVRGKGDARRVGPNLAHLASKLTTGFTDKWIFNPRAFRPSTWMPHFFLQENNGAASANQHDPDPVGRTEIEVLAMRTYLFALSEPWEPEPIPQGLAGDADRGRDLFDQIGCLACHANLAEYGAKWIPAHMEARGGKTAEQARADFNAMSLNRRIQYAWDNFTSDRETVFYPQEVRFDPEADYNRPVFTRFGPDLSAIGSKVAVEWLYAWLRDPHAYAPDTKMPSLNLSEQEALDLAVYLGTLRHDEFDDSEFDLDAARRRMADELVFSLLTAQRSAERSRRIMDDRDGSLTRLLIDMTSKSPGADQARQRLEAMDTQTKRLVYLGGKMISHYGCYACHLIPGLETATRPGTELTTWAEKPISQLDFAFFAPAFDDLREKNRQQFEFLYPADETDLVRLAHGNATQEVTHTHASFAHHKMRNPRMWDRKKIKQPYQKLKMPNFYFSQREADALVTYLVGRRPPRVGASLAVDYGESNLGAIAAGRRLTRELNCVGCHSIEDNVATVHQYYRETIGGTEYFDEVNAPPALRGEGAKLQHAWFYGFLQHVERLRPWLKVRMPGFTLSADQNTTLVEYFAALSGYESDGLSKHIDPALAYLEKAELSEAGLGGGPGQPGDDGLAPGHDWFEQPELRSAARHLGDYAVGNRLVGRFALDPSDQDHAELAEAYMDVLERAAFIRDLYDVPYPFVDAPRPLAAQERFELGEKLTLELGCLKCHVLGDPDLPGANTNPTAPNLNLTFRRLRQEWVRQWLRDPAWIQPGTKMPQLFPDGRSAFADYGDLRAGPESRFGSTSEEQIELLLDYIYNAGLKNHTTVDPRVAAAEAATKEGEQDNIEEEFDEDDE